MQQPPTTPPQRAKPPTPARPVNRPTLLQGGGGAPPISGGAPSGGAPLKSGVSRRGGPAAPLPAHFYAIRDLVQSEQRYVATLNTLVHGFLEPLRKEGIVSQEDEAALVGPVERLLQVNSELSQKLSPPGEVISLLRVVEVFAEVMEPLVKVYEEYCANYKRAKDKLNALIQDPIFCTFIEKLEVVNQFNLYMLRSFLIQPLQRICHYPLTLKELTKYLPAEADPGKWKETILRLESTATAINLSKAEAKDIEKLFDIEKKLDGLETQIALAGRKLVLEGPLKIKKKQVKDGHVYLFNDALVLSKTAGAKASFAGFAALNKCVVRILEDFDKTATGKHGFEITNLDTHKKWQFYCQNSEERQKWVQKIHDATSALLSIGSSVWGSVAARTSAAGDDAAAPESLVKLNERVGELEQERQQMAEELNAFRFVLRGERNEKLNLMESNFSLSSKSNKQKLLINKLWNHLRSGAKLGDAELKVLEAEVKDLLGTLAIGAGTVAGSPQPPSSDKQRGAFFKNSPKPAAAAAGSSSSIMASERKSNADDSPAFYHASKHSSPYYYYAEKQEEGDVSAEEVNLFQYITRDDETDEGDERRASVAGDDKQRRVSVAKPAPGASLTQKIELPDDVIKVGYLSKKGAKRRNWKDRWFILKKESIGYYASPSDATPKGTISLRRCSVFNSTRKPFCFHVSNLNRDYYIVAKNQQEQKEWMEAITACIDELKKEEEEQPEAAAAEQQRSAYQAGAEKEGTLMYEESPGRWLSNWLSLKEGRLYLFGSRTDAWPHGVIELEGCAVEVESAKPEEEKKKKKKGQFVFLIMNPTVGSTRFCGASERERAEWVTAIDMACRNAEAVKKAEEEAEAKAAAEEQTEDDEAAKLRALLQLYALRV